MGMGIKHGIGDGNGKPPQWECELPELPWEFIPIDFFCCAKLKLTVLSLAVATRLNLKYEAEPDRERFNTAVIIDDQDFCTVSMM